MRVLAIIGLLCLAAGTSHAILCGDGQREGMEECDNGMNNSDTKPDKCRTDCTLPSCGDYVEDSGEECDDGRYNSDEIPRACRRDCKKAYCGDGVRDEYEECDDKNTNAYDGCHQCQKCYQPKDNLNLSGAGGMTLRLCPGQFEFTDTGEEGIVIVSGEGTNLDCQGVILIGKPPIMQTAANISNAAAVRGSRMKNIGTKKGSGSKQRSPQNARISARDLKQAKSISKSPGSSESSGSSGSSGSAPSVPRNQLGYQGTGIVVNSPNIVLHNCQVKEFKTGVKLKSSGAVLHNNHLCENQKDIVSEKTDNYGIKNVCSRHQGWTENGQEGCTQVCK